MQNDDDKYEYEACKKIFRTLHVLPSLCGGGAACYGNIVCKKGERRKTNYSTPLFLCTYKTIEAIFKVITFHSLPAAGLSEVRGGGMPFSSALTCWINCCTYITIFFAVPSRLIKKHTFYRGIKSYMVQCNTAADVWEPFMMREKCSSMRRRPLQLDQSIQKSIVDCNFESLIESFFSKTIWIENLLCNAISLLRHTITICATNKDQKWLAFYRF